MKWLLRKPKGFHVACILLMGKTYQHLLEEHGIFEKDLISGATNNLRIHINQHEKEVGP